MSRQPAHSPSASAGLKPAPSGPCPCPCPLPNAHVHRPLSMSWSLSPPNLCHSNLLHHLSSPPYSFSSLLGLETHVYEADQQLNMATLTLLKATQYWPSKRSQCCFVMVLLPPASKWWYMGAPVINVVPDVPQTAPATTCPSYTKTEFLHCTLVQLYLRPTSVYSYPAYARPRPQIATTIAKPRGVPPTLKSVFCTLPCKDKRCPFPVNESSFIPEYTAQWSRC